MRTAFKISPRFPVRHELAKQIARFCIREAIPMCRYKNLKVPEKITFTMFAGNFWDRSGRSYVNTNRIKPMRHNTVFIRCRRVDKSFTERYHGYKDSPTCFVDGTIEMYVHLCAHELGHAVCGFEGDKIGEFQCERFAAKVLDAWRLHTQDPACMI